MTVFFTADTHFGHAGALAKSTPPGLSDHCRAERGCTATAPSPVNAAIRAES